MANGQAECPCFLGETQLEKRLRKIRDEVSGETCLKHVRTTFPCACSPRCDLQQGRHFIMKWIGWYYTFCYRRYIDRTMSYTFSQRLASFSKQSPLPSTPVIIQWTQGVKVLLDPAGWYFHSLKQTWLCSFMSFQFANSGTQHDPHPLVAGWIIWTSSIMRWKALFLPEIHILNINFPALYAIPSPKLPFMNL